ncbi:MAG: hypothetical protein KatS3mg101_0217 [Patescibacteria group bacterium]|nr:MAG: hypothetical protein KatS3mg101_0217 [Patescibacteria group bacterium]
MFYLIAAFLILVVFVVTARILSSLIKGCLIALGVFIIVITAFLVYKSSREPVELFGIYRLHNFEITKL